MFSSKPVVRTTDPVLLEQKAIAFLDKNYTRAKTGYEVPDDFYMLEPKSINGMKKLRCQGKDKENIKNQPKTLFYAAFSYDKLSDGTTISGYEKLIVNNGLPDEPIWYRIMSGIIVGNSARNAVLGGTRRRKSRRRQRKSYKR
jgi:hypothetical protein